MIAEPIHHISPAQLVFLAALVILWFVVAIPASEPTTMVQVDGANATLDEWID